MGFELSICIPTYNRQICLKDALDSIVSQITDDIKHKVEICISDNASEDETKDLVYKYKENYSNISINYFRQTKNEGVDNNILKTIEIAQGKYYWGIGDDDIIEQGAIKYVLDEIKNNPSIYMYYVNFWAYDSDLKNRTIAKHNLWKEKGDIVFNNSLECMKRCGEIFGFLSAYIIHRETLYRYASTRKYIGTIFFTVYYQLSVLREKESLKYISKQLLGYRQPGDGGKKTFFHDDPWNMVKLGTVTHNKITREMFGKNSKEFKIMKNFRFILSLKGIVFIIINKRGTLKFRWKTFCILFGEYWGYLRFWIFIVPILLTAGSALKTVKNLYMLIKK